MGKKPKQPVQKTAPTEIGQSRESRFPFRFTAAFTSIVLFFYFFASAFGLSVFHSLDYSWVDQMFRWRGLQESDPRITLVAIDDESLERIGSYPWPRGKYVPVLDNLFAAGAKVVGMDVLFPDRSLPRQDAELVRVTRKYGKKVVHSVSVNTRVPSYVRSGVWGWDFPFQALKDAGGSLGLVSQVLIDVDGSVRNVPLFTGTNGAAPETWVDDPDAKPSLGLKMISVYEGKDPKSYLEATGGNFVRLNLRGMIEGRPAERVLEDGTVQAYALPSRDAFKLIPAWRAYENDLDESEFARLKDGIVLIGSTARGAPDHFPTAFHGVTPGMKFHANLIDNLLRGTWLRDAGRMPSMAIAVLFAVLAYKLVALPALLAALSFVGLLAGWSVLNYFAFLNLYVVHYSVPTIVLVGVFAVLIIHKTMLEQQQKAEVRQMFGQYVAPEVVDVLVKDPSKLRLGGEKRDMTMFFLDIAHFTTISEKMAPENLIKFLNHYLTALTDDVLNNNGVVDKYIGDCIMAFWNAPLEVENHRTKACLAAVACMKTIERLNKDYVDPTMPEKPAIRIGLNSGEVVVGNTGSARKLAYTVLGDEVNLSSRLEGANKFFGSTIMTSEDTYEEAKDAVEGRVLGSVRVVGKETPIKVFELLAKKGELSPEWQKALPLYEAGIELYLKRDFEKAKDAFQRVLELIPGDKPTKLYLNVCEDYIAIPPPEDQELVFNLTSK